MLEAEKALVDGLNITRDKRFAESLVQLYVNSFDRLHKSSEMDLGELVRLLERAVKYGPKDTRVANRLAILAAKEGDEARRAQSLLKEVLARGIAPAVVHQILGTLASNRGENETAIFHLEQAYRLKPNMLVVLNNLAWTLAKNAPPQLDRALKLANAAVELSPDDPHVRDTRGRILAALGQYKEALVDLEIALPAMREDPEIHHVLADLYEDLGDEELQQTHQRLAEEIENREMTP
jgi:Flp pilus assembly protein TadD